MDHADMFRKAGQLKQDIAEFVDHFRPLIAWKNDGTDSLLDIGCAGGDVTVDVLKPILPVNFSRIMGVDISETMVKYAKENFDIPKVSFDVLDITGDVSDFEREYNTFDHIHSSAVLNMIPDQMSVIKNIYKLLKPNGDCILYIVNESSFYEAYRRLDKNKWGKWMQGIDDLISSYSQRHFPKEMLKKHLASAGFLKWVIEERHPIPVYENIEMFKSECPFGFFEIISKRIIFFSPMSSNIKILCAHTDRNGR